MNEPIKDSINCQKKLDKNIKYCYTISGITFPIQLQKYIIQKCKESAVDDYQLCFKGLRKTS